MGRDKIQERGGVNLYTYCENEGVWLVDALGLETDLTQMADKVRRKLKAKVIPLHKEDITKEMAEKVKNLLGLQTFGFNQVLWKNWLGERDDVKNGRESEMKDVSISDFDVLGGARTAIFRSALMIGLGSAAWAKKTDSGVRAYSGKAQFKSANYMIYYYEMEYDCSVKWNANWENGKACLWSADVKCKFKATDRIAFWVGNKVKKFPLCDPFSLIKKDPTVYEVDDEFVAEANKRYNWGGKDFNISSAESEESVYAETDADIEVMEGLMRAMKGDESYPLEVK